MNKIDGFVCAGIGFVVALIVVTAYSWVQSPFDVMSLLFDGMEAVGALGVPVVMWLGVQVAKRALLVNENRWRVEAQKINRDLARKIHDTEWICQSVVTRCLPVLNALYADMRKTKYVNLNHVLSDFEKVIKECFTNEVRETINEETQVCFDECRSHLENFKNKMCELSKLHAPNVWVDLMVVVQGIQQTVEKHTERSVLNESDYYKELVEMVNNEWAAIRKSIFGDEK